MSEIQIIEVTTKKQRKTFVAFPNKLYAGCSQYVPPIMLDELETFDPQKNPAHDTADARLFLAMSGVKVVGRIAGIVSHAKNEARNEKCIRFGWFDCINDLAVSRALFNAVETWGKERGLNTFTGPHGFNEFDKQGMLVEGFEHVPSSVTYYNYAYYNDLVADYGFTKDVDWVEYLVLNIQENEFPPRLAALAERVAKRRGYRVLEFKKKKELMQWAPAILDFDDEVYSELYSYTPITKKQKEYYTNKFFPFINKDLIKVVVNTDNEIIGFFIALPSMSKALQKTKGHLLPFGWLHLLKALRPGGTKMIDLVLGGVKKEYRGRGVDLVMSLAMHASVVKLGYEQAESTPELEDNTAVRSEWKNFDTIQNRRRRLYTKPI